MKANKLFFILATLLFAIESQAQDLGTILFGKDNKATYMGQYNYNGKRKNGFGIERYKQGGVYIGDFSENDISGRGMYISAKGQYIDKNNKAAIYVGAYRDGKKSGKGTYYDATGKVIYEGKFENDKPVEKVSQAAVSSTKRFVMKEIDNELYWGEVLEGVENGMGLKLAEDGKIVFGKYKEGIPVSIGMVFYSPDIWEVGQWTDGTFVAFNNSSASQEQLAQFKDQFRKGRQKMWSELAEAGKYFAEAAILVTETTSLSNNNVNLSDLEAIDSTPTSSGNNYKEANDKKREERKEKEKQNNFKKNDKLVDAAYSKCEDNIIDMYVNPEHYSNLSKEEFRRKYKDLQKKLKKIRTDHEQKTGSKYYVSEYETKACPV